MLNRARRKFIIWAMVAMIVIVVVLIAAVNIVNRNLTDNRLDAVINEIVHTKPGQGAGPEQETGMLPGAEQETDFRASARVQQETGTGESAGAQMETGNGESAGAQMETGTGESAGAPLQDGAQMPTGAEMPGRKTGEKGQNEKGFPDRSSAMNQYGNRYFIAGIDEAGELNDLSRQQEIVSEDEAARLARLVMDSGQTKGYVEEYKFLVFERDSGNAICFLDCSVNFSSLNELLLVSIVVGAVGIILGFLFILVMSRKTVEPVRISIEKQKQFITNAGHELKTPLSAIATNTDILEMDLGDNEWVSGTKKQVRKLRKLVENLVSLSKMEEEEGELEFRYFCISDIAEECIDGFDSIAAMQGIEFKASVEPGLYTAGDPSMVQQLLSILCDNAVKYAVGEEPIEVKLYGDGRNICFETANDWAHNVDEDQLDSLFERFYRGDPARAPENKSSGHGLGLSIAKAIAEKNHARLTVSTDSAGRIIFRAVFRTVSRAASRKVDAEA